MLILRARRMAAFAIALCPLAIQASPIVTITCHDLKGSTLQYGVPMAERVDAKVKKQPMPTPRVVGPINDGYQESLTLVVDSASPTKLAIVWNESAEQLKSRAEAKKYGIETLPPQADEATVISASPSMISALIENAPNGIVLYTFFPKSKSAFITTHSRMYDDSNTTMTSVRAACEFAGNVGQIKQVER